MIKILEANYLSEQKVELVFSTHEKGTMDFSHLISKKTELTKPLENSLYFQDFFIELGALGWKNGLELSPKSLYEKLQKEHKLEHIKVSA